MVVRSGEAAETMVRRSVGVEMEVQRDREKERVARVVSGASMYPSVFRVSTLLLQSPVVQSMCLRVRAGA